MSVIPGNLAEAVEAIPAFLASRVENKLEGFCEQDGMADALAGLARQQAGELVRVVVASDFFSTQFLRHGQWFLQWLGSDDFYQEVPPARFQSELGDRLQQCEDLESLEKQLRDFRNLHMMRIAWRDASDIGSLEISMRELSSLADACVHQAYNFLYTHECNDRGTPAGRSGEPQQLCVLGMGKLGARELNFSSDIDLIFCFPENGETEMGVVNQDFFNRLGKKLINALSRRTADGFVFRVDMRLRPLGSSGSLTLGFNAMETYYEEQGREWERYAMVKARPIAGDIAKGKELLDRIRPFIYRRYIDFGVLESLRDMKGLINQEVRRKGNENNIKLGEGGIREVEFVVQALQLISGGRHPELQDPGLLSVMPRLVNSGLLDQESADNLAESYRYLRILEHRLQAINDEQTQSLPASEEVLERIAWLSGHEEAGTYLDEIEDCRCMVRDFFSGFIAEDEAETLPGKGGREKTDWLEKMDNEGCDAFAGFSFAGDEEVCNFITGFGKMTVVKKLQETARDRLNQLFPQLLEAIGDSPLPMPLTRKLFSLVEKVVRRSVYLALLNENPGAFDKMVDLMQLSDRVTQWLTDHPALLEELTLERELRFDIPWLADQLQQQMLRIPEDEVEQQMECLRHFQKGHQLRCASEELHKSLKVEWASQYLSNLAEVLVQQAYTMAFYHVTHNHGLPSSLVLEANFAIIGYGKMGGQELSYGSDLDLVFLHHTNLGIDDPTGATADIETGKFYARLGQRLIHILSTRTMSGQLYEVDARLRPSGASGLLVSSMDAFEHYQKEKAWVWEHQALVRARWIAGDQDGRARFEQARKEVLCMPREESQLKTAVIQMRERMVEHLGSGAKNDVFDIKHDPGGIVDIEFMVQYAVLRWAHDYPELIAETSTLRLLDRLAEFVAVFRPLFESLQQAYRAYREETHLLALDNRPNQVETERFATERGVVKQVWRQVFGQDR